MKKPAHKVNSTTQKFTEIVDIQEDVVLLSGNNACSLIEITATNFALLSQQEQDTKLYSYASLLNSLAFPVQIIIRNKKLDISYYLRALETQAKNTQNEMLAQQINLYRDFVAELVKVNTVLDKKFYICIPYSYLEKGAVSVTQSVAKKEKSDEFLIQARTALRSKAETLLAQIARLNLRAKILEKEELIRVFFEIYNDENIETNQVSDNISTTIIKKEAS